jgi:NDP-sugar pyrophosphorylase family protein
MKPSLVILAAGLGSRYGGIKQLDGFGPNGERIIDYTVHDALEAGFGKIIFVIRKEIETEFRAAILDKWQGKGDFEVVYQTLDAIPKSYTVPEGRVKPWGTAHAVWMAAPVINEPFGIVNADDFYGKNSLKSLATHLESLNDHELTGCMVGYELEKTITDNGTVSRGVCEIDEQQYLKEITERTAIARGADGNIYYEEKGKRVQLNRQATVSMNLMGFTSSIFKEIAAGFDATYQASKTNLKAEYYIPLVLSSLIEQGIEIPVLRTDNHWFGVTYSEDKTWVKSQLKQLVADRVYPDNLFNND